MPLSDHEQRMLDQIESALYAEDPKFASSVRGGNLRAPSARRRLQGAALFVIGLAMLVCGCRVLGHQIGGFPILCVIGFIVMFGGVVFAITGRGSPAAGTAGHRARRGPAEAGQGLGRLVHQPHGGPVPPPFRRVSVHSTQGAAPMGLPLFLLAAASATSCAPPRPTAALSASAGLLLSLTGSRRVALPNDCCPW